jgi:hypothetical protein
VRNAGLLMDSWGFILLQKELPEERNVLMIPN